MTVGTNPVGVIPHQIDLVMNGAAQLLIAANAYRTHLQIQAPDTIPIMYSYTNSAPNDPAATTAIGCFKLFAGQTWGPTSSIPTSAIYINGGAAGNTVRIIATEC